VQRVKKSTSSSSSRATPDLHGSVNSPSPATALQFGAPAPAQSVLGPLLKANGFDLAFSMLNIGARPVEVAAEPFWQLLDVFPASSIAGVELDPHLCDELNRQARDRVRYYPAAIGRAEERRPLYQTSHPMCTSLYRPDSRYCDLYNEFDGSRLTDVGEITTSSLDKFVTDNGLGEIDFLKIDIQGGELDAFRGGPNTLRQMLLVVTEVEFVPIYENQPLFGDVAASLKQSDFMFHKFLGMAGRVMKPLSIHGSGQYPAQFMWSDAVFMRDIFTLKSLPATQLLKLAVLLDIYDSKDVALHVLRCYDDKAGDDLADIYLQHLTKGGAWELLTQGR
jgi:protein O-GlcNAc transferase